jgi:hypothetical protein
MITDGIQRNQMPTVNESPAVQIMSRATTLALRELLVLIVLIGHVTLSIGTKHA